MSGTNGRGLENYHPETWTAPEGSNQAHPLRSNPPTFTTPRSITPRGAIFTNLGEAHQAITSGLASRSAGNHIPATSSQTPSVSSANATGPTNSAGSLPSPQNFELAKPASPVQRQCLSPLLSPSMSTAEWDKVFASSSPAAPSSDSNPVEGNPNGYATDAPVYQMPNEMGTTMESTYDQQYLPSPVAKSPSSSEATAPGPKPAKNPWQPFSPASDPPKAPLPELPHVHGNTQRSLKGLNGWPDLTPATQSAKSVSNSEELLGEPTKGTRGSHEDDMSHCGVSVGGGTSDSDEEDPFRYDRGSLTIFVKPAREREVSVALRCVSEDSTLFSHGNVPSSSSNGPTPRAPSFSTNGPAATGNRAIQSNNPFFNKLNIYETPAINYDWDKDDDQEDPSLVKISVRPQPVDPYSPPPAPPNSPVLPAIGPAELEQLDQSFKKGPRAEKAYTLMSDGVGDWETVITTVGRFDSNQFDSNRAFASSTDFSACHPAKITGSSIADYSDDGDFQRFPPDPFSSTERILQLPTTKPAPNTRYHRTLKDTGRPVFLPKPRIHRVNGYLQDSSRIFTDPTTGSSGNSARSYLVEKLGASIRSRTARKRGQLRNPYCNLERLSKSGSLDSFFSVDAERKSGLNSQEKGGTSVEPPRDDNNSKATKAHGADQSRFSETDEWPRVVPVSKPMPTAQQNGLTLGQSRVSFGLESPHLFNFPLISLEEAARRQRMSDDVTTTSGARTRKDSSVKSSKATHRTTPPTPHITKPLPTHRRYPTPAGAPGSTMSYYRYSGYSPERNLNGHKRGISDTSPFRGGASFGPRQSVVLRPFRNTFDSVNASSAGRPSFLGQQSVIDSPRLFGHDKRNWAGPSYMAPDLRQIAHLETAPPFGLLSEDPYLSWEARKRRQTYYYAMCILCIFPFMAPLIYRGTFDSALSWYTRGETSQLNQRQRRNVFILGIIVSAIWLCSLAVFVTLAVKGNRRSQA